MSYRGPNKLRITQQVTQYPRLHAGETATWRQYISAGADGTDVFGLPNTDYYREQLITAQFRAAIGMQITMPELQTLAGQVAIGDFVVVTQQQLKRRDELQWRGTAYRIESDSVPSKLNSNFMNIVKRGL